MADIEPPPLDKTPCADCGCGRHLHQIGPFQYCGTCAGCRGFVPVVEPRTIHLDDRCARCGCRNGAHNCAEPWCCTQCSRCTGFLLEPLPARPVPEAKSWIEVDRAEVREGMTVANLGTVTHARHFPDYSHIAIDTPFGPSDRNFIPGERLVVAQADVR